MERFEVKRGLVKTINSEGGLISLANKHFENVKSSENDEFTAYLGKFRDPALVSRLFPFLTSASDHLDASSARLPARDRRPPSGNSGIRPTLG